jgi:hypothetical protein
MRVHHEFNISFNGYPSTHKKVESVYCIEGVYVGASIHTRQRILQHIHHALRGTHQNEALADFLRQKVADKSPIVVHCLSHCVFDEKKWIDKIKPKFNRSQITYTNRLNNIQL